MKIKPRHIFFLLCLAFVIYSFSIYLMPMRQKKPVGYDHEKAAEGRLVWQKYNCQSCHQLYGLGGYLGPDLTNAYSTPGKGATLIKAIIKSGTGQMPPFNLSDIEEDRLIEFLKSTDASGTADPRHLKITTTGMVERK